MLVQLTTDECHILADAMEIVEMSQSRIEGWSRISKDGVWTALKAKLERAAKLDRPTASF